MFPPSLQRTPYLPSKDSLPPFKAKSLPQSRLGHEVRKNVELVLVCLEGSLLHFVPDSEDCLVHHPDGVLVQKVLSVDNFSPLGRAHILKIIQQVSEN